MSRGTSAGGVAELHVAEARRRDRARCRRRAGATGQWIGSTSTPALSCPAAADDARGCARSFASVQGMNSRFAPSRPAASAQNAAKASMIRASSGSLPATSSFARRAARLSRALRDSRRRRVSGFSRKISMSSTGRPVSARRRAVSRTSGVSPTIACCGFLGVAGIRRSPTARNLPRRRATPSPAVPAPAPSTRARPMTLCGSSIPRRAIRPSGSSRRRPASRGRRGTAG